MMKHLRVPVILTALVAFVSPVRAADYSDDFNRANGAIGASWTQDSGTWTIASNVAGKASAAGFDQARYASDLGSADHYCEIELRTNNGGIAAGPAVRMSATGSYALYIFSPDIYIVKIASGSPTTLNQTAQSIAIGQVLRLEAQGTTLRGYVDGVLKLTATDSTYTTQLRCGMFQYGNSGGTIDNWRAGDLVRRRLIWYESSVLRTSPLFSAMSQRVDPLKPLAPCLFLAP
jgi:hypothetical protein